MNLDFEKEFYERYKYRELTSDCVYESLLFEKSVNSIYIQIELMAGTREFNNIMNMSYMYFMGRIHDQSVDNFRYMWE